MDTTIKVNTDVRDRLATLARERGCTIGELVSGLAAESPTRAELDARHAAANAHIRQHLVHDFDEADSAAGERLWRDLAAGRISTIG